MKRAACALAVAIAIVLLPACDAKKSSPEYALEQARLAIVDRDLDRFYEYVDMEALLGGLMDWAIRKQAAADQTFGQLFGDQRGNEALDAMLDALMPFLVTMLMDSFEESFTGEARAHAGQDPTGGMMDAVLAAIPWDEGLDALSKDAERVSVETLKKDGDDRIVQVELRDKNLGGESFFFKLRMTKTDAGHLKLIGLENIEEIMEHQELGLELTS